MIAENKVPEIRFKGFSGEWEENSFSDISESLEYGLNAAATKYDGENKYIRITDINEDTRALDLGDVTSPNADLSKADNYILQLGDILFARTGASVGKTYIYRKQDGVVYFAGFLIRARVTKEVNTEFVFQSTLTEKYNKFIRLTSQRSGQPGVNAQEYGSYKIFLAPSKEQTKIGNYFQQLDTLIAQHQQKHDKLLNLKKSLLEKMFPKQGATVPEIRFKGFSGEWQEKALGNTRSFYTDGNYGEAYPSECDLTDSSNGIPFLRGSNLSCGQLSAKGANYITKEKHSELTSGTLVGDDIVIAVRGSLGALGYVKKTNIGWNINSQLAIIRTDKKELKGVFLIQYLLSEAGQRKILSKISGSALKQLPIGQLKLINVPEEQTKIGNFFKQLDTLINQHQAQLKKLGNIKQACLEKMFV